ncbi:MAG: hypothetical protein MH219_00050 [Marinobacter sp.]|nr:hypothetical protein [Marinobacter sp.]
MSRFFVLVIFAFPIGFQAVAYSFLALGILETVVVTVLLVRVLELNVFSFYRTLLPDLLITLICAAATFVISIWIPFEAKPAWKPIAVIALCLPPPHLAFVIICTGAPAVQRDWLYSETKSLEFSGAGELTARIEFSKSDQKMRKILLVSEIFPPLHMVEAGVGSGKFIVAFQSAV